MCKQALSQHSHMDTHTQSTTIHKGQSWPRVKRTCTSDSIKLPTCVTDMHLFQTHGAHHGQPWFPLMLVLWDTTTWVCPRTTWQPKPWPTGWSDHHGLLHKLNHYGISGNYNRWRDCKLPQRLISTGGHWGLYIKNSTRKILVCSTSLMASFIRSVGGLSKCFYQGLWLVNLKAEVIGQSINRRGVA